MTQGDLEMIKNFEKENLEQELNENKAYIQKNYIDKFHINSKQLFDKKGFIKQLSDEFTRDLKKFVTYNDYEDFRSLVRKYQQRFSEISQLKSGNPLSKGLWNAFYAITVVPIRTKLYPEMQQRIMDYNTKRGKISGNLVTENLD